MKKYFWFYEFKNIFHKYFGINSPLIIEFGKPSKLDEAIINKNDLKGYNFDFNKDLKDFYQMVIRKTEKKRYKYIFLKSF